MGIVWGVPWLREHCKHTICLYSYRGMGSGTYSEMLLLNECFALIFNCNFCALMFGSIKKLFQRIPAIPYAYARKYCKQQITVVVVNFFLFSNRCPLAGD